MSVTVPTAPVDQPFQPLYPDQTEDAVLNRMIGWANEGLDPVADAAAWVDTREGGHWRTANISTIRELARLYDLAGSEVPMSGFVLWSWGTYLDDLAAVWQVFRLPATPATGVVTFDGPAATDIAPGITLSVVPSTPDDPTPEFEVVIGGTIPMGGSIDLAVQATQAGKFGNVAANAIIAPSSPLPAGVTFTNAAPTSSGSDPETDESLRARLLAALAGKGPGAVADYIRWAQAYPGVGRVQVVPIWNGPGTVLVMISDVNGDPLSSAIVTGFQTQLDPTPGLGHGIAPIGANASVETSTLLALTIAATLVYETGYSWDGFGGSTAVGPAVLDAINAYLLTVPPGGDVVYERIKGLIATTVGVHDVTACTIDAGSGPAMINVPVELLPTPKAPYLATFTPS